jgi:hypothetical protein
VTLAVSNGCGGGEEKGGAEVARAIEPEAQARAETTGLNPSDFPDGWQAAPAQAARGEDEFRRCLGIDFSAFTVIGEARSDGFARSSARASSDVGIFESEDEAEGAREAFLDGMASDRVDDCMKEFLEASFGEGFAVGDVEVGELTLPPPDVEDASRWQVVIPIEVTSGESAGVSTTGYLDLVHLREGEVVATVTTLDVQAPFEQTLRDDLVQAVAERMRN